jgi:hypothetical protein
MRLLEMLAERERERGERSCAVERDGEDERRCHASIFEEKTKLSGLREEGKKGQISLGKMKSANHFPKFFKHFLSNKNYFPVDYYFHFYQTLENAEIIFQKSFYAETNGALNILWKLKDFSHVHQT